MIVACRHRSESDVRSVTVGAVLARGDCGRHDDRIGARREYSLRAGGKGLRQRTAAGSATSIARETSKAAASTTPIADAWAISKCSSRIGDGRRGDDDDDGNQHPGSCAKRQIKPSDQQRQCRRRCQKYDEPARSCNEGDRRNRQQSGEQVLVVVGRWGNLRGCTDPFFEVGLRHDGTTTPKGAEPLPLAGRDKLFGRVDDVFVGREDDLPVDLRELGRGVDLWRRQAMPSD